MRWFLFFFLIFISLPFARPGRHLSAFFDTMGL
jgi:hypothetical protein